jgi:NitT/TauT family transport system substrate-binding protein
MPTRRALGLRTVSLSLAVLAFVAQSANAQPFAPAATAPTDKQRVTVRFTWKLTTYYAPLFVALDRGYYSAEGLDVDLKEGSGAENVVRVIATGTDPIAYGPATVAAEAVSRGLPVIVVAVYLPKVPMGLISFPNVPLKTPKDLEGKRLGVSIGETFSNMLVAFARLNNIDLSKVTTVQLTPSAVITLFMARKIDVMSLYLNDQVPLLEKQTGIKFNVLNVADFGLGLLGQGFIVNADFAKSHPDALRGLLRATAKGYADTFKDPAAAVDIMRKHMAVKPDPAVMAAQLKATLEATAVPVDKPLGWQDQALWQANLTVLKETGRIEHIRDLSSYFTNAYLQ